MPNQQLVDYIKSQLALSVTKPDLIKAIQVAGWTQGDMDAAFGVAEGRAPTPKPPAPVVPVQPAPATIQPTIKPAALEPQVVRARPRVSSHDPGPGMRLSTVRGPFTNILLYILVCLVIIAGAVYYLLPILRPLIFGGIIPETTPPAQTITPDQGNAPMIPAQTASSTDSNSTTTPGGATTTQDITAPTSTPQQ